MVSTGKILPVVLILLITGLAASATQHHPFSEVFPPDSDLNFGGYNAENISQLGLQNGYVLSQYSLMDEGNNYVLRLDPSTEQFKVIGADLNLSNNQIVGLSNPTEAGDAATKDYVDMIGAQNLSNVLNEGNSAGSNTIDMNGNSITGFFQSSSCPSGEAMVDVGDDGSFQCMNVAGEVTDVYVNRTGDTMGGNLDMANNNIEGTGNITSSNEICVGKYC